MSTALINLPHRGQGLRRASSAAGPARRGDRDPAARWRERRWAGPLPGRPQSEAGQRRAEAGAVPPRALSSGRMAGDGQQGTAQPRAQLVTVLAASKPDVRVACPPGGEHVPVGPPGPLRPRCARPARPLAAGLARSGCHQRPGRRRSQCGSRRSARAWPTRSSLLGAGLAPGGAAGAPVSSRGIRSGCRPRRACTLRIASATIVRVGP
jgi:hypothetical protein